MPRWLETEPLVEGPRFAIAGVVASQLLRGAVRGTKSTICINASRPNPRRCWCSSIRSRHRKYGPRMPGAGVTFQLSITKPTGSSSAYTTRYQGAAWGVAAAYSRDSTTELTKRSWLWPTRSARTASRFSSVISRRLTCVIVPAYVSAPHSSLCVRVHLP
jgi:hypothetical protein